MSPWNYRVTRKQMNPAGDFEYEIREVYYSAGDQSRPYAWSERGVGPWSDDSVEDLKADHALMAAAFDLPVLDIADEDNPYEVEETSEVAGLRSQQDLDRDVTGG